MLVDVNYWAVLLALLSTLVVGSVWYAPRVFGNYWMRVAQVDPGDRSPVGPIVTTFIVSFISAWVLRSRRKSHGPPSAATTCSSRS